MCPKFFWPSLRKNCYSDHEKLLVEQYFQTLKAQYNFWYRTVFKLIPEGFPHLIHQNTNWKKTVWNLENLHEKLKNIFFNKQTTVRPYLNSIKWTADLPTLMYPHHRVSQNPFSLRQPVKKEERISRKKSSHRPLIVQCIVDNI